MWFWDEAGFSLRVIRRKRWGKKGSRKKVAGRRRQGRFSVMGWVRFSDKKRVVDFIKKGTGESFFDVLKGFYRELQYEWAGASNNIDDFEKIGSGKGGSFRYVFLPPLRTVHTTFTVHGSSNVLKFSVSDS